MISPIISSGRIVQHIRQQKFNLATSMIQIVSTRSSRSCSMAAAATASDGGCGSYALSDEANSCTYKHSLPLHALAEVWGVLVFVQPYRSPFCIPRRNKSALLGRMWFYLFHRRDLTRLATIVRWEGEEEEESCGSENNEHHWRRKRDCLYKHLLCLIIMLDINFQHTNILLKWKTKLWLSIVGWDLGIINKAHGETVTIYQLG